MEELELLDFRLGRYGLGKNGKLTFISGNIEIKISKKSALEITHTLLDSLNLLDKDTEELLYEIEERIENER